MNPDYKKFEDILRKNHYPPISQEELLGMINNIKIFAELIDKFEKRSKKIIKK